MAEGIEKIAMNDGIACRLDGLELQVLVERWRRLIQRAALDRLVSDDRVRIRFRADAATSRELRDLVAAERACCGDADWQVREGPQELTLQVVTTPDGVAALRALFASADRGRHDHRVRGTEDESRARVRF